MIIYYILYDVSRVYKIGLYLHNAMNIISINNTKK